jgi:mannose-6-phosphate isomerase-like protein (cupin superfamily)
MTVYSYGSLARKRAELDRHYFEFLRCESMSAGLYALPSGGVDEQSPHNQDEVYVVVKGSGCVTIGDETCAVDEGSVVYVPAKVPHRFHDIAEDLHVLVVFAPPESE